MGLTFGDQNIYWALNFYFADDYVTVATAVI
jgi:hypothetical protein